MTGMPEAVLALPAEVAAIPHWGWENRHALALLVMVTMLAEGVAVWTRLDGHYTLGELKTNMVIFVIGELLRKVTYPLRLAPFLVVWAWTPLHFAPSISSAVACYVVVDFLYYVKHRYFHHNGFFWALHIVHHSSTELNLTTPLRMSWVQRVIEDFVFLPAVAVGFHPVMALFLVDLNLLSLGWVHTRALGRVEWLEGWLNTPGAHRLHHSTILAETHSNFGATFMVWDRLFGTYCKPENHEPQYGTSWGDMGGNVLRIQFAPLLAYARRKQPASSVLSAARAGGPAPR